MSDTIPTLRTVKQFAEQYDEFSYSQIRYLIFNSKINGMENSGALVRMGKRVYINVERFYAWALSNPRWVLSGQDNSFEEQTSETVMHKT